MAKNNTVTLKSTNARIDTIEAKLDRLIAMMESQKNQESGYVSYCSNPDEGKAEAPAEKKANTFKEDVIVARAKRTPEEKAEARSKAIEKAASKEADVTRRLEAELGLKANSLKNTLVSVAELANMGVEISRKELKEIKAKVRKG